jgi:hypothetical protein
VIPFFLGLDHIPVRKTVQSFGLEIVGELQIQIGGIEFLIDLVVQKFMNLLIHSSLRLFHVCLPQAMEVAVSIYSHRRFIAQSKGNHRIAAGLQAFSLAAAASLQIYPRDVVLIRHGMRHGTNGNFYRIALAGYNGNVLFIAGLYHTGLQLGHFLTAAHHRHTGVVDHAHHIAAMLTYIEFVLTHDTILRKVNFIYRFCLFLIY